MADIQWARPRQTAFRISSSFIYHLRRRLMSENSSVGLLTAVTLHTFFNLVPRKQRDFVRKVCGNSGIVTLENTLRTEDSALPPPPKRAYF
jgi:hypothetical protein